MMKPINLAEDIKPVSEFRAHTARLIEQVKESKRALVLTQRGRSSAVVIDVGEYERLKEELEVLRDIHTAEAQIAEGNTFTQEEVRARLLAKFASE